jgi:hypothetical protein
MFGGISIVCTDETRSIIAFCGPNEEIKEIRHVN